MEVLAKNSLESLVEGVERAEHQGKVLLEDSQVLIANMSTHYFGGDY
ncbi:MAG: hypothetical protein U9Q00_01445 [Synergistota bacterium]|nr:hypothetical protein [Synergistota bacterium]